MTRYEFRRDINSNEFLEAILSEENEPYTDGRPVDKNSKRIFKLTGTLKGYDGKAINKEKVDLTAYSYQELFDKLPARAKQAK